MLRSWRGVGTASEFVIKLVGKKFQPDASFFKPEVSIFLKVEIGLAA